MITKPRPSLMLALILAGTLVSSTPAGAQVEISSRASKLRIGGRIHSQFAHSSAEEGTSADFFIRRARLNFDIQVTDLVDGRLEHDFAIGLRDAYLRLKFDPAFQVSVGQFKRGFDLFELYSTTQISVVERTGRISGVSTCAGPGGLCSLSQFTEKLGYAGRDVGMRVQGDLGGAAYLATVTNGEGAGNEDVNGAKSFAARVVLPLGENLRLGGNVSRHDYPTEDPESTEYGTAFGTDLEYGSYLQPGPHFQVGLIGGDNWKAEGEDASFLTGQAVYMHYIPVEWKDGAIIGLEPVARVSWGDPDRDMPEDGGTLFTPGLMVYFKERTRIGGSLDVWKPQTGDTEFSLKIQTYLWF